MGKGVDMMDDKKKPKGIGLLIGIGGGPKKGRPEGDDESYEDDDSDDDQRELKLSSMKAFMRAVSDKDPEAMLEAYEALKDCY